MQLTFWQKARYWVLLIFVFLIIFSVHPTIVSMSRNAGLGSGTILSRYIIVLFGVVFVMCFHFRSIMRAKLMRVSLVIYLLILFYYLITWALFGEKSMLLEIRSVAICLIAVMIGWQFSSYRDIIH